jgi:hypothetical protein
MEKAGMAVLYWRANWYNRLDICIIGDLETPSSGRGVARTERKGAVIEPLITISDNVA